MGAPERYAHVAREMRLATDEDSDQIACDRLVEELEALNADLKIPSLSEAGVERDHFERVVRGYGAGGPRLRQPGLQPRARDARSRSSSSTARRTEDARLGARVFNSP